MAANAKPCILYDNRMLDGTPTATDTATDYDVLNIRDLRPYTWWKAASAGTKYITVNCGSVKAADTLAVIGHNLYMADADVSVESSSNGTNWTARLAPFTPASDHAFLKPFTGVSAQHWRVKIVTASAAAQVAVLILGSRLTFERYAMGPFDPAPESIEAQSSRSKTGNLIGNTLNYVGHSIRLSFRYLTPSWVSATFKPAWDAHLSLLEPFFFAWDTENHGSEVLFVKIPDDFGLSMPYEGNRRSLDLEFEGVKE